MPLMTFVVIFFTNIFGANYGVALTLKKALLIIPILLIVVTSTASADRVKNVKDNDDKDILKAAILLGVHARSQPVKHVRQQRKYQSQHQQLGKNSIWYRVRGGFRLRNDHYRPEVKRMVKQFQKRGTSLNRVLNRSSDYLHFVVTELQKRKMPTDLVLLPMVESAYRTQARSHAGAVGMWQFISSTGKRYGLKQTRGYDGRMDIIQSTRAAMDYLQKLHREFRGDWLLALAAYNSGEHRVHREIEKNRARGLPTDYWNLSLPRETKNYIPILLAYREVIRQPQSFGVRLPVVKNIPVLVQVTINKSVDLRKVARKVGLHSSALTKLNPGYRYGITMPQMTRRLMLPRHNAGNLLRAIQSSPAIDKKTIHRYAKGYTKARRKKRVVHHRVRSGENLSKIASHYGTTVKKIMRLNKMRSTRIRAGKKLRVAARRSSSASG